MTCKKNEDKQNVFLAHWAAFELFQKMYRVRVHLWKFFSKNYIHDNDEGYFQQRKNTFLLMLPTSTQHRPTLLWNDIKVTMNFDRRHMTVDTAEVPFQKIWSVPDLEALMEVPQTEFKKIYAMHPAKKQ